MPDPAGTASPRPAATARSPEIVLGFDFGTRRIGVALGNTLTRSARPLEIVASEPIKLRFARIAQLLDEWQPASAVVGLALDADGAEQPATGRCRRFADQLRGRFGLAVTLQDERGSSLEAQEMQVGAGADDALAAAVILQRYLDAL